MQSSLVDILSSLLTPLIALLALYIAFQQYQINRRRLKFDTYERKLAMYKIVNQYFLEIQRDGHTNFVRCSDFYSSVSEVFFLFSESIQKAIDEVYTKSIDMITLYEQLYPRDGSDGLAVGEERTKISHQNSQLLKWHLNKFKEIKELFRKEMAIK